MDALYSDKYKSMIISHSILLRNRNVSNSVESIRTHFISSTFFPELCHLWDNVEKYCTGRQAADGNLEHALCILEN